MDKFILLPGSLHARMGNGWTSGCLMPGYSLFSGFDLASAACYNGFIAARAKGYPCPPTPTMSCSMLTA